MFDYWFFQKLEVNFYNSVDSGDPIASTLWGIKISIENNFDLELL
jgi:hypothetical protein